MKTILTNNQKLDLEKCHRTERDGKVRDRIKAVLLHSEGWTQENIAQALRINPSTVWDHLNEYKNNGSVPIPLMR
jgi:predicted ArsR family transcriptional regulator